MTSTAPPRPSFEACLRNAAEERLLTLLFERPRAGWHAEIAALTQEIDDPELRSAAAAAREASEGFHLAFLGNGSPVSPREVAHRPLGDPGHLIAQLRGLYAAFGYAPGGEEPLDHVATLVGFLAFLSLKQAFARERSDEWLAESAARARSLFTSEHLAFVAEPLCQALERHEAVYLPLAARALLARVGPRPAELERGWTPQGLEGGSACSSCTFAEES